MNLIIPMAGRGSRLRPHTLTVPKPLVALAGKPIVQQIAEDLVAMQTRKIEHIGFIIHPSFGSDTEALLLGVAEKLGAEGHIFYQESPEGTAHAIYQAQTLLNGPVLIAFADTLFRADQPLDTEADGAVIVQEVEDPSAFGVVKLDNEGFITDFVEKPDTFVSNKAIIGIYYFKAGETLRTEIKHLLDNDIREKGEYQLTNALEALKQKGQKFVINSVREWLDCGNYQACVYSNQRILDFKQEAATTGRHLTQTDSLIVQPCHIGDNVTIEGSIVGPHVSIGSGTTIRHSVVRNSVVQADSLIENQVVADSMIGHRVVYRAAANRVSLGDFTSLSEL